MELLLITILFSVCILGILCGVIQKNGLVWYPFLSAAVILGWVMPQIIAIYDSNLAPGSSLSKTVLMIILSYVAGWVGYSYRTECVRKSAFDAPMRSYSHRGLRIVMAMFALIGSYFFFKISQLAAEAIYMYGGAWTGVITIFVFFAALLTYALALSLSVLSRRIDITAILTVIFSLAFILHRVVIQGRREAAVQLVLFLAIFIYLRYKWLPSRAVQIMAIIVGAVFVTSVGDYRATMLDTSTGLNWTGAGLDDIARIDFASNFDQSTRRVPSLELFNAVLTVAGSEDAPAFDLGLSFWNGFVHSYVPGQFIGAGLKADMMIDLRNVRDMYGFQWHVGTTSTGFADAFRSFWYFGSLLFFLIGRILRYWMYRAQNGDLLGVAMIMLLLPESLLAITHSTHNFFLAFVSIFVFLIVPLRLVSAPRRDELVYI